MLYKRIGLIVCAGISAIIAACGALVLLFGFVGFLVSTEPDAPAGTLGAAGQFIGAGMFVFMVGIIITYWLFGKIMLKQWKR